MKKQTIYDVQRSLTNGRAKGLARALRNLEGLPVGSWPHTQQAIRVIRGELPIREFRAFTATKLIEQFFIIENDRFYLDVDFVPEAGR